MSRPSTFHGGTSAPAFSVAPRASSPGRLWVFLWGAGERRLHLGAGPPGPGDEVVESLEDLLAAVERRGARAAVEGLLGEGLLERWIEGALGDAALAEATRAIRRDDRGGKIARWLQRAGARLWFVAGEPVDTVEDLARLPLRVRDLRDLWNQIRQRVPQERFAFDPRVVAILDGACAETGLPGEARALGACLDLGLDKLPVECDDGLFVLERPEQIAGLLDRPGARARLGWLLEHRLLERWAERARPGSGAAMAEARSLGPPVGLDRAVRALDPDGLHVAPGMRARGYADLARMAAENPSRLCGGALDRDRIRDALFHAPPIAGTPTGVVDYNEAELATWPEHARARLFGWVVLRVPLAVAGHAITTCASLLEALADRSARERLRELAETGMLSLYACRVLGVALPEALAGRVPAADFPSLCTALGEEAPEVLATVTPVRALLDEGGALEVAVLLSNLDPVRAARVELSTVVTPRTASAAIATRVELEPGGARTVPLACRSLPGRSGAFTVEILASGARLASPARLEAQVRFAWRPLLRTALAWTLALALVAALARAALAPCFRSGLSSSMLAAWASGGASVGVGYGLALGLRAAHRPALGEVARALVLLAGAAAAMALGR